MWLVRINTNPIITTRRCMNMLGSIKRFLIGRPMKSNELGEQKLNKTKALAILSSDALIISGIWP